MQVLTAVKEFLAAKRQLSPYTRRSYRQRLGVFADWCCAHDITLDVLAARDVRAFLAEVSRRPVQASTLRVYATAVKSFLGWAARESDDLDVSISPTIAARIEPIPVESKVMEVYTDAELAALFAAASQGKYDVRDRAILAVLVDTGSRASEVVNLTVDCVWLDPDDSYILVHGKGKKQREIPMGRDCRLMLRRYITRYRRPANRETRHVFLSQTGQPLRVSGLQQLITRIGKKADVEGAHPHRFRHHYACQQLLSGTDIFKLSRLMGHQGGVRVTERYLSAVKSRQARQDAYSVLDHLNS